MRGAHRAVFESIWASSNDAHLGVLRCLAARALRVCSWLYHAGWWIRQLAFRSGVRKAARLPRVVVGVGNLTVGGSGKTPMTCAIAAMLLEQGWDTVVISRGYRAKSTGGVREVSNREQVLMPARESGDEPAMLARQLPGVPVLIGAQRREVGRFALDHYDPDVLVLDDAFQHQQLHRDIDIILFSGSQPAGNGYLLPRGPLREPLAACARADCAVITLIPGESAKEARDLLRDVRPGLPLFEAHYVARDLVDISSRQAAPINRLEGSRYLAFCGLARPDRFRTTLTSLLGECVHFEAFPDHHSYERGDLSGLFGELQRQRGDFLVTTEKDAVKLQSLAPLPVRVLALRMAYSFAAAGESFESWFLERLRDAQQRTRGGTD